MTLAAYSTTAANNTALFPEGMPPSAVNNKARQMQADLAAAYHDTGWVVYGAGSGIGDGTEPAFAYVSASTFRVGGTDVTAFYHAGRRVRATGTLTGTIYGTISGSTFSTDTDVGVAWDSGSLVNETLTIAISIVAAANSPLPVSTLQAGNENLFINGDMRISQRGTSFAAASTAYYATDRWLVDPQGATVAASQFAPSPGFTAVGGSEHIWSALQLVRSSPGVTGNTFLAQRIEDVRTGEGNTITLSFLVYSPVAIDTMTINAQQFFGTGGSPSAAVNVSPVSFTVNATNTWERKTVSLSIPSISGKTLGTNNDHFLVIALGIPPALGNGTWRMTHFDARIGPATPPVFVRRQRTIERILCERYFQNYAGNIRFGMREGSPGTIRSCPIAFPTIMRSAPTVSGLSYSVNGWSIAPSVFSPTIAGFAVEGTAPNASYLDSILTYIADAEL
jgi:hypothetical protein